MTTVLEELAAWHEEQARAHESSVAILKRFELPGGEWHVAMMNLHRHFAVAVREAIEHWPVLNTPFKRSDVIRTVWNANCEERESKAPESARTLKLEESERLKHLFHKCWGASHDSPSYDKKSWMELQFELQKIGVSV